MKHVLKKSRIQYLIDNRNGYLVLASGSIILNILLSLIIYYVIGFEKVVLVPPSITREFWVSQNSVSPEYLQSMSLFLAELRFNLTPANAAMERQLFLKYVDSSQYEKLNTNLIEEEEHLKKEHITITFYATEPPRVDPSKLIAKVTGDLQYIVGDSLQPMQHVTYQISYRLSGGRLMIRSLEEVKDHV
ncbi:MAG: type IV conjugative transfer system protein TraE [Gammaproteobacteria bacterium]